MINKIAGFISVLFSPILFFFLMPYIIVYYQTTNVSSAIKWTVFSLFFVAIAMTLILVGQIKGVFSDRDLSIKEEREEFYVLALILSLVYLIFSALFKGLFFSLSIVSLGIFIGIFIFSFVNLYIKASIHVGVAVAFVIAIYLLYGLNTFLAIVWVLPLVMWSRLRLKLHSPKEMGAGALIGFFITIITFLIATQII